MANQLDVFGDDCPIVEAAKNKPRDVNKEAKALLDKTGISGASKELKMLIAAKLMAEHFPELHRDLLMSLATTATRAKSG